MGAKFFEEKQDDIAAMHALCARRVPGHSFPRHASYAGLPVQYHYAFSWIVGFFV